MNRQLFLVFLICNVYKLSGQITKYDLIIGLDGNYQKTISNNGIYQNNIVNEINSINIAPTIGFAITNKLIVGLGLDYVNVKSKNENTLLLNDKLYFETSEIKSKGYLPILFIGDYFKISNRLYINLYLSTHYGKIESESEVIHIEAGGFNDSSMVLTQNPSLAYRFSDKEEMEYFDVNIRPELLFLITERIGLNLKFGYVGYSISDWKSEYSNWIVSFNPNTWNLGFRIRI